jgi:hypothetical protein
LSTTHSSSGTQLATISVEHTLYSPTSNKWFSGYVDLSNMKSGDRVELRVYVLVKTAAGGAYVQYYVSKYTGTQTYPLIYIPLYLSDNGWKLTLKQTSGTGKTFGAFTRPRLICPNTTCCFANTIFQSTIFQIKLLW